MIARVDSRTRSLMTQRATVERDQTTTSDPWGQSDASSYAAHATIPCRVWSSSRKVAVDVDRTATIEEIRAIFPADADVIEADRIAAITDRRDRVVFSGPLSIETIRLKGDHLTAMLQRVE